MYEGLNYDLVGAAWLAAAFIIAWAFWGRRQPRPLVATLKGGLLLFGLSLVALIMAWIVFLYGVLIYMGSGDPGFSGK
ncbi:hypothetical protein [Terrihabitans rhizophilus]|uniref:Uncharacterized protein n=1 Tax=Terrihabitans rhizophilus TaxID=3092662 RepID=A0ABU4RU16_9HYPH|nr:hypothetical protein [Terrihabitans sp. PJ23]MDX6807160.1 hypothetical protein [Terrihabitans sp. PJ23]